MNDKHKHPKGAGKSSFELINTKILADILPVEPGSVVLDLACGRGLYSMFLSGIIGDQGLVYAVDFWQEGIGLLDQEIEARDITNIKTLILDVTQEIDIDDDSVDVCLVATVLHDFEEINKAGVVLKKIHRILKPGGCLAVVEFKKIEGPPGPPMEIRLSEGEVEKMVARYGFKRENTADMGQYNYLVTFRSRKN
ncbi:UbiE1 [Desulforapulum autotrophicum HRM2]|uniref:UbiE1 n=1 Tax=Desulforapulum autotrophicum (strain ATCC 43914 / DSM 3382 / VKM B-1955 / HRM2) TaxID=177437 RepID=C0QEA2_DESAH|nr:class I SAM-dependent methyltransferase [Desulforapulum autotrophicum]ACN13219.1 UbiE1 [Desulforapulum autotrophicum HRM2]